MELLSSFTLNPLRIYTVPKRIKNKKGVASFPAKHIASYLDYSVDFSNQLNVDEVIIQGKILCNRAELKIHTSFFQKQSLTAFLSAGKENLSFYLTFMIKTNQGNAFVQEVIVPTFGCFSDETTKTDYQFIALDETSIAPENIPPLNALSLDRRYFIYKKKFIYYGIVNVNYKNK